MSNDHHIIMLHIPPGWSKVSEIKNNFTYSVRLQFRFVHVVYTFEGTSGTYATTNLDILGSGIVLTLSR